MFFCCCFLFVSCSFAKMSVTAIVRTNHDPPSSNSFIVSDSTQLLVVDIGRVEADFTQVVNGLNQFGGLHLNGLVLTVRRPSFVLFFFSKSCTARSPRPCY